MSTRNIIRAWKDEEYRSSLTETERALLPEHPAGLVELSDAALDGAAGGFIIPTGWEWTINFPTCNQCYQKPK